MRLINSLLLLPALFSCLSLSSNGGALHLIPNQPTIIMAPQFPVGFDHPASVSVTCSNDVKKYLKFASVNVCGKKLSGKSKQLNEFLHSMTVTYKGPKSNKGNFWMRFSVNSPREIKEKTLVTLNLVDRIEARPLVKQFNSVAGKRFGTLLLAPLWRNTERLQVDVKSSENLKITHQFVNGTLFLTFDAENQVKNSTILSIRLKDELSGLSSQLFKFKVKGTRDSMGTFSIFLFLGVSVAIFVLVVIGFHLVPKEKEKQVVENEIKPENSFRLSESITRWKPEDKKDDHKDDVPSTNMSIQMEFKDAQLSKRVSVIPYEEMEALEISGIKSMNNSQISNLTVVI